MIDDSHTAINQSISYLRGLTESAKANGVKIPVDAERSLSQAEEAILTSQSAHSTGDMTVAHLTLDTAVLRAKQFVSLSGIGEEELPAISKRGVNYLQETDGPEDMIMRHNHPKYLENEDY